jgi:hypothetical protein
MKRQGKNIFSNYGDAATPKYSNPSPSIKSSKDATQARYHDTGDAANWRASERGFASGSEIDDWFGAEANLDNAQIGNNNVRRTTCIAYASSR